MLTSPFQPVGNSITLTSNAVISTSTSALVQLSDLGCTQAPASLLFLNTGAADIWVSITRAAAAAAFPVPGTATAGTPSPGFRLRPGIARVFGLNVIAPNPGGLQPPSPGFFVNSISGTASQPFDITPGEGA